MFVVNYSWKILNLQNNNKYACPIKSSTCPNGVI